MSRSFTFRIIKQTKSIPESMNKMMLIWGDGKKGERFENFKLLALLLLLLLLGGYLVGLSVCWEAGEKGGKKRKRSGGSGGCAVGASKETFRMKN
ncbi:unnamed protein product [Cercopithifilaria johnstoni]|uniref:Uncharacterized protein n=1 Tax=Cercopithifilaria johnstoni TaxID=2874296 RepID=A0A8J2QB43_9BILA|nr:unnamed protein product [Cercopithifilaria johnstoni]